MREIRDEDVMQDGADAKRQPLVAMCKGGNWRCWMRRREKREEMSTEGTSAIAGVTKEIWRRKCC